VGATALRGAVRRKEAGRVRTRRGEHNARGRDRLRPLLSRRSAVPVECQDVDPCPPPPRLTPSDQGDRGDSGDSRVGRVRGGHAVGGGGRHGHHRRVEQHLNLVDVDVDVHDHLHRAGVHDVLHDRHVDDHDPGAHYVDHNRGSDERRPIRTHPRAAVDHGPARPDAAHDRPA
jgi:hypothetical protein